MMARVEGADRPTILVVDDTPDNLVLISALLRDEYRVKVAVNGEIGLRIAQGGTPPDLILLDIMMPDLDGYDVCRRLKADPATRDVPVIFLTARSEEEDERKGLELGAVDYVTKPISPSILVTRIRNHLALKSSADFLRSQADFLAAEVARRTEEIAAIQDVTILVLTSLAETRDVETGNHIRRTQHYVRILAEQLKTHPRFGFFLSDDVIASLYKSAPLHDIGKVGVPDSVLLKPGRFTPEDFEIMKTHTALGRSAIESAERTLGVRVDFLHFAKEIAYSHHEKWDGTGYPEGLTGEDIPISARLMALADVYDALITRRVYKDGMSHDEARVIILEGRGSDFDPDVVGAFLAAEAKFRSIAETYS